MTEGLPATIMDRLVTTYGSARDPERAAPMAAYLRDQFPLLGIPAPTQKLLARQVLAGLGTPTEDELRDVCLRCWELPEREYQYFGCGLARRYARVCSAGFLPTAEHLITTKSWWDTVDALAAHLVGPLVRRHGLAGAMDGWIETDRLWLIRTALLHQLTYAGNTDADRLFRYCLRRADHTDFFIRKAIGWALRQYARTDPAAVRAFVAEHRDRLAPLSVREALKNL
jgi:3-methyladenine DNA glycosylase AlkD